MNNKNILFNFQSILNQILSQSRYIFEQSKGTVYYITKFLHNRHTVFNKLKVFWMNSGRFFFQLFITLPLVKSFHLSSTCAPWPTCLHEAASSPVCSPLSTTLFSGLYHKNHDHTTFSLPAVKFFLYHKLAQKFLERLRLLQ